MRRSLLRVVFFPFNRSGVARASDAHVLLWFTYFVLFCTFGDVSPQWRRVFLKQRRPNHLNAFGVSEAQQAMPRGSVENPAVKQGVPPPTVAVVTSNRSRSASYGSC